MASLGLIAVGVVFGDIGTSPIYAFRAAFAPEYALSPTPATVLGLISLIVWALTLTVSIKYVAFIMRADNRGEGGILALLALVPRRSWRLISLGLFGAALLYGDGIITPAISVLSAVEGLGVASPELAHLSVPISVIILFALFAVQRYGTHRVGRIFGPVMVLWFLTIAVLGLTEIVRAPRILAALDPLYAWRFLQAHGLRGLTVLGAVVLAVTGAEALYADMGFFGKRPIRMAWFGLVFPALVLNYAGQGALVLRSPASIEGPFYLLAPATLRFPLVFLATAATVIASQALISGVFALTNQTVQLGFSPRFDIVHTAPESKHVYVPAMNRVMMLGCLLLVITFRSSQALGAAYGIAVTGTMVITTVLFADIARHRWRWSRTRVFGVAGVFLVVDLAFLGANTLKIAHGGWVPLAIGVAIWTLMTTWAWGRGRLLARRTRAKVPLTEFLGTLARTPIPRVPGTVVYLTSHPDGVPRSLTHLVSVLNVLQKQVVLVCVDFQQQPHVPEFERVEVERFAEGFFRVTVAYGFLEQPDLPAALRACRPFGLELLGAPITYVVTGERLVPPHDRNPIVLWRKRLFAVLVRNSRSAPDFFNLPLNQVIEVGQEVPL